MATTAAPTRDCSWMRGQRTAWERHGAGQGWAVKSGSRQAMVPDPNSLNP